MDDTRAVDYEKKDDIASANAWLNRANVDAKRINFSATGVTERNLRSCDRY